MYDASVVFVSLMKVALLFLDLLMDLMCIKHTSNLLRYNNYLHHILVLQFKI